MKRTFLSILLCLISIFSLFSASACELLSFEQKTPIAEQQKLNEIADIISNQKVDGISLIAKEEGERNDRPYLSYESFTCNFSTKEFDLFLPRNEIYAFYRGGYLFYHEDHYGEYGYAPTAFNSAQYLQPDSINYTVFRNSSLIGEVDYQIGDDLFEILFGSEQPAMGNMKELFEFFYNFDCISLNENEITIDLLIFFDRFMDDFHTASKDVNEETTLQELAKHQSLEKYTAFIEKTLTERDKDELENQLKEAWADYDVGEDIWSTKADYLFKKIIHKNWKEKLEGWKKTVTKEEFYIEVSNSTLTFSNANIILELNQNRTLSALSVVMDGEMTAKQLNNVAEYETISASFQSEISIKISSSPFPLADLTETNVRMFGKNLNNPAHFEKTFSIESASYTIDTYYLEIDYLYDDGDAFNSIGQCWFKMNLIIENGQFTQVSLEERTRINSKYSSVYPAYTLEGNILSTTYRNQPKKYRFELRENSLFIYEITPTGEVLNSSTLFYNRSSFTVQGTVTNGEVVSASVIATEIDKANYTWVEGVEVPSTYSKDTGVLTFSYGGKDYRYELHAEYASAPFEYPFYLVTAASTEEELSFTDNIIIGNGDYEQVLLEDYIELLDEYYGKN